MSHAGCFRTGGHCLYTDGCHQGGCRQMPMRQAYAPQDPNRSGQAREARTLTEADVRRIVAEELAKRETPSQET